MNPLVKSLVTAGLGLAAISVAATQDDWFLNPERIRYDKRCLRIEGKDFFAFGGAFHYFRVPKELWADRFKKMKEAGFNTVETYVPWNYHEREAPAGPDDFSKLDLSDLVAWIEMANALGFHTIIRPGPYICAEWAGGGYPQWLVNHMKPSGWPEGKQWLQTDDPEYIKWSDHWVGAVAKAVAPYQITRRKVGEPGVILFQIENEYERVNWLPKEMKRRYLESLANVSRKNGIEVPLVTCWTTESRNAKSGPLAGVFDFINLYPKWDVRKQFDKFVERQLKDQPNAPLAGMELQGGWYSAIGGKLSRDQDGVAPVQTQNLTFYAIQKGFSVINYYMLVGGTNFYDWASREATTTYDFAAAIGETGGVGERYRRLSGIGAMLKEHGTRLIRSELIEAKADSSDPAVEIAVRKAADGSLFVFVRTEDRGVGHRGKAKLDLPNGTSLAFDYELEPFGSKILHLPAGAKSADTGTWYPRIPEAPAKPGNLPAPVKLAGVRQLADPLPKKWIQLKPGESLDQQGVFFHHPVYYRVSPSPGAPFTVERIGDKVISQTGDDTVLAMVKDKLLKPVKSDKESVTFDMPTGASEAILLFSSRGLHHHTRPELEKHWPLGITRVTSGGKELPLAYSTGEKERGLRASSQALPGSNEVGIGDASKAEDRLLMWYQLPFELPKMEKGTWAPWVIRLHAKGSGFVYLNGHCIGRTWEEGPQRDFFLPDNLLNPGAGNLVAVSLHPDGSNTVGIASVEVDALTEFAESR